MAQTLNLYHPGLEPPAARWTALHGLIAAGLTGLVLGVVAVALGVASRSARQEQLELQARLDTQREHLARTGLAQTLPTDAQRELQRLRQIAAGEQRLQSAIETGEAGGGSGFSPELIALARQAQARVWLTTIQLDRAGNGLTLAGRTTDAALLTDYLQSLQGEAVLRGRPFAQMQVRADGIDAAGQPLPYAEFSVRSSPGAAEPAARASGAGR